MFVYNFISTLVFGTIEPKQSKQQNTTQIPQTLAKENYTNPNYYSNHQHINPHFNFYQQQNSNRQQNYQHKHNSSKSSFKKTNYSNSTKMPPAAYSTFHAHPTTTSAYVAATMSMPNNNSSNKTPNIKRVVDSEYRYKIVDEICAETNLYTILGVERDCNSDELRRAYISRSRICHPDKFPEYPKATEAFQKLAYAYETLNKPSTRRAYDISGTSDLGCVNGTGDETLHGVLYQLFLEFMDGDFEMIRALVNALNEGNPGLNLGEDAIETLETAFRRMRELLLAEFEQLGGKHGTSKGLLGDGMAKVITGLVTVLDRGEKFV
ncbi:7187_t:CDS:2 [Scutellospora calospora]|uniref:7187_t:CDS:1 n=1 Tax=Scutellospora calospora TaxID=85575 RepID=A0ACA9KDU4_9GLOM|nr:7187_t:CDS:2 [Scutellospora calospora]